MGHWKIDCSFCCSLRTASIFALAVSLILNVLILGFSLYDQKIVRYIKPLPDFSFLSTFLALITSIISCYSLIQIFFLRKRTAWLLYFVVIQTVNCIFDVFFILELLRRKEIRTQWESTVNETTYDCSSITTKGKTKLLSLIETTYPDTKFIYWLALVTSILINAYFAFVAYGHVREVKDELVHPPAEVAPEPDASDKKLTEEHA